MIELKPGDKISFKPFTSIGRKATGIVKFVLATKKRVCVDMGPNRRDDVIKIDGTVKLIEQASGNIATKE